MAFRVSKRTQAEPIKPKLKPAIQLSRPIRDSTKPVVTISTAPILRRQARNKIHPGKPLRKQRRHEHEHAYDFQDDIETCRASILAEARASLNATHAELNESLEKMHLENTAIQEHISAQCGALTRPLSEDQIETTFTRPDGSEVTEVRQIGKRVEEFKAMVSMAEAELKQRWAEWEEVQKEIVQLGVDILGPDAFEQEAGAPKSRSPGYKTEMDELDLEHKMFLEKMRREVPSICLQTWEKMDAAEAEIDLQVKNQKRQLLAKIFEDDDFE